MQKIWSAWMAAVLGQLALAAAQREPACPAERRGCVADDQGDDQMMFFRVNNTTISVESSSIQLNLECHETSGRLDVAALPRYSELVEFEDIYIINCFLGDATVPRVLGALNVNEKNVVTLGLFGLTETLRADQFAGLNISTLKLSRLSTENWVQTEEIFFEVFQNLTTLQTKGIQYEKPPNGLVKWDSTNAKLKQLYAESVSTLKELYLVEPDLTNVSALSAAKILEVLSLTAPIGELPPPPALAALKTLTLHNWSVSQTQWLSGEALVELQVEMSSLERPPARWLGASPLLQTLTLRNLPLRALPADLLRNNAALRELTISDCGLTSDMLPPTWLDNNVNLEKLDLSHNNLTSLPSDRLFARLKRLSWLDLSHNQLAVAADARPFLVGNRSLRSLLLDHNPLGELCAEPHADGVYTRGHSWLRELTQLTTLSLQHTAASRLCRDWLYDMPDLAVLDLRDNRFTNLTFADLQAVRAQPQAAIRLQRNPLTRILYSAHDYRQAVATTQKAQATVKIDSKLTCDCQLFLFASALRQNADHARVQPLMCAPAPGLPSGALGRRPLELLQCAADCGAGCACREAPARGGVLAACRRLPAGLARPRPDSLEVVELSLVGANLTALPSVESLPPALQRLDLRNNYIGGTSAREASALMARGVALRLAGNPLHCGCGARALVDLLLQHKDRVDFEELLCSDGSVPAPAECGLGAGAVALLGVLGALVLASAALAGALLHPRLRARLKTALRVLGVHVPVPGAEPARRYDAFVSFAEADARWVAGVLVPALEAGPRPRRLCLHYRDWAVGEYIPQQIAASVRDARRTLLVVSDAFARSAWARAEFDEAMAAAARDGRPPPLALLLAPPAPGALAAAPALADFLRAATYLRADDPRFRDKLRAAVPAQR